MKTKEDIFSNFIFDELEGTSDGWQTGYPYNEVTKAMNFAYELAEAKWIKFEDKLPTEKELEQVKVLLGHPKWATWMVGLYSHHSGQSLKERLAIYNFDDDSYVEWDTMLPTHYMIAPAKPLNEKI